MDRFRSWRLTIEMNESSRSMSLLFHRTIRASESKNKVKVYDVEYECCDGAWVEVSTPEEARRSMNRRRSLLSRVFSVERTSSMRVPVLTLTRLFPVSKSMDTSQFSDGMNGSYSLLS